MCAFYTLNSLWRRLPTEEQAEQKQELLDVITSFNRRMLLRPYSTMGTRADAELLLWQIAETPLELQELAAAIILYFSPVALVAIQIAANIVKTLSAHKKLLVKTRQKLINCAYFTIIPVLSTQQSIIYAMRLPNGWNPPQAKYEASGD